MASYYKRQFLNDEAHGGSAHIEFKVDEVEGRWVNTTFSIGDCGRTIDLDFTCGRAEDIPRMRAKFARLRRAVLAFGAAYNDELDRLEEMSDG